MYTKQILKDNRTWEFLYRTESQVDRGLREGRNLLGVSMAGSEKGTGTVMQAVSGLSTGRGGIVLLYL